MKRVILVVDILDEEELQECDGIDYFISKLEDAAEAPGTRVDECFVTEELRVNV